MAFNFILRSAATAAAIAAMGMGSAFAAVNLPALKIDKTQTTVSGLSAGGFMAVQLHVAYSATFAKGAGVVAGGPFYCAEGSIVNATGRCMVTPASIPTSTLVNTTNTWASQGLIDPVANLQASKVYLFSGTLDSVVKTGSMDALRTYYNSFVPAANVVYKKDIAAEHAMVTDDYGNGCSTKGAPYISDCNFDLAGAMLQHLYGTLNARNNATLPAGNYVEFNQNQFITNHGMATTGWAYIPQACQAGGTATCRLHVVLHGCKQNVSDVQQQYVRNTGYNRWADTNNIVMLYPQTSLAATNSCFDWWGYDNANYAKKSGPQMVAIKAMVDQVSSGGGTTNPPTNPALPAPTGVNTSGATASSMVVGWGAVSGAASYNVYRNANKVNALPVNATSYTDTGLAASTSYSWTVRAADGNGAEGATSAAASGTTLAAPGGGATCTTASNYAHTMAGRAYVAGGYTFALGSNQAMGLWNVFVTKTLKQTSPNYYVIGTCP
ncbi:extracellular catalytic domain type 2 short-chain-length polyhydroxyalkanoate depolymerase [Acidovorax sp.]|uniref:extracellular catalytic domain type 2 short-chain-length polyhydroxyalkanoate depolymerase n=1 Tax=Acidovorax sp. TaxID=1872122 RepID=UPI003D02CDE1